MIQKILNIEQENLENAIETLQKNVTLVLIKETSKKYYKLSDNTIIPQNKGDYEGTLEIIEDYTGDTYQNEYYRQIDEIINYIEFNADMEGIDYETYLGWSIVPVEVIE